MTGGEQEKPIALRNGLAELRPQLGSIPGGMGMCNRVAGPGPREFGNLGISTWFGTPAYDA